MSISSNDDDSDSADGSVIAEGRSVDPNTLEDLFVDDDNYWLSEDQLFELQTERDPARKVPPPLKDWSELEASTNTEVII